MPWAAGSAVCQLEIQGTKAGNKINKALLDCSGGNVSIAVDETWLGGAKARFRGVSWSRSGCSCASEDYTPMGCMLTFCDDTEATFIRPILSGLRTSSESLDAVLCVCGKSNITFHTLRVHGNKGSSAMAVWGAAAVSIVDGSKFTYNRAVNTAGGALCAWGRASIEVTGAVLSGNAAVNNSGGAISVMDNVNLVMAETSFLNNTSDGFAGGAINAEGGAEVLISEATLLSGNSVFNGNGGAVAAFDNVKLTVKNSTMSHNKASYGSGGAIFADYNASVIITDASGLTHNEASFSVGGGALALADYATATLDGGSSIVSNFANYSSGGGISVRSDTKLVIIGGSIVADNRATLYGGGLYVVQAASATIDGGSVIANNTANSTGADISAAADESLLLGATNINISSPTLSWTRMRCVIGEVKGSSSSFCSKCGANTYSLNTSATVCDVCPTHASCSGGDVISPLPGFWSSSNYSTQIHSCPRAENCQEGGECSEGYVGNVCGSCAEGYGTTRPLTCRRCIAYAKAVAFYVCGAFITVCIVLLLVRTTLHDNLNTFAASSLRPSHFLKVFLKHLQYLVIISSVQVQWPEALTAMFTAVVWVFSPVSHVAAASIDCVFSFQGNVPLGVNRVLVVVLAPVTIFACVSCFWVVGKAAADRCRRASAAKSSFAVTRHALQLKVDLVVTGLVVLFVFYPSWTRAGLEMFACIKLDSPKSASGDPYPQYAIANAIYGYWVSNMHQACWEGWHLHWGVGLGVPLVLIFCFAIPCCLWLFLWKNSLRLSEPSFRQYASFVYHDYSEKRYYWEVVNTLQIAVTIAISVFSFTLGAYVTCLLLNLAFACFLSALHVCRPFMSRQLQQCSVASMACLYGTTVVALSMFAVDGSGAAPPVAYNMVVGVLAVIGNAVFLLWCLYQAAAHSGSVVVKLWKKGVAWLLGRCRWLPKVKALLGRWCDCCSGREVTAAAGKPEP
jgi:hypothetical protein